jgi:hypothetical protein
MTACLRDNQPTIFADTSCVLNALDFQSFIKCCIVLKEVFQGCGGHLRLGNFREFDAAVREWEVKPAATRTWQKIKSFISAEYAKKNKQSKVTAKKLRANAVEEQADATEELIANLTEIHTRQIESVIRANTKAMKEKLSLVKAQANMPTNPTNSMNNEKKRKREERQKKFLNTPVCKHCGKKHPSKQKMSAGNWTRMQHCAQHHGNQPRASEGAWGSK